MTNEVKSFIQDMERHHARAIELGATAMMKDTEARLIHARANIETLDVGYEVDAYMSHWFYKKGE